MNYQILSKNNSHRRFIRLAIEAGKKNYGEKILISPELNLLAENNTITKKTLVFLDAATLLGKNQLQIFDFIEKNKIQEINIVGDLGVEKKPFFYNGVISNLLYAQDNLSCLEVIYKKFKIYILNARYPIDIRDIPINILFKYLTYRFCG
jgi:hypothetical protein